MNFKFLGCDVPNGITQGCVYLIITLYLGSNMQTPTPFCGMVIKETLKVLFIVHIYVIFVSLQINQIPFKFIKEITSTSQNKLTYFFQIIIINLKYF
jgi:hypothetical protein